jgi:D-lactate dehydrogenase (cytochrome)
VRLFRLLDERGALDDLELAFPEDDARRRTFADLREAVPAAVTELLAGRRRREPEVRKVGGDMIVPFEQVVSMVDVYTEGFARRGLDYAIWGHLGDGNLHANALPRNAEDVRRGFDALMEFGREAARRGGAPLSEHGVGRNPVKQALLEQFLGQEAVGEMRAIKAALDPEGRLARGVVFPPRIG